jgi:hypothetical protein
MKKSLFLLIVLCLFPAADVWSWGFFAHQRINRLAVFCLPPEMMRFFKAHIRFLEENAVNPDERRYAVEGEAPRHYIDLDVYGDSALARLPRFWPQAVEKYSEDTLMAYGIVPWHIQLVKYQLTEAFKQRDAGRILRLAADLGHYVADANVPLHTTENYNGQLTGQHGIHGLWESRLPELLVGGYDCFVGKAEYVYSPQERAWRAVAEAHAAVDSVLLFERQLSGRFPADKKYSYEQRGNTTVRVYSRAFAEKYHQMLDGQVERRMRASIKMVADFWYTCWVDAGQPDLTSLLPYQLGKAEREQMEQERKAWESRRYQVRPHDTGCNHPADQQPGRRPRPGDNLATRRRLYLVAGVSSPKKGI